MPTPCHGFALYHLTQGVATPLGELLGVVEEMVVKVGRQDYGCRIDRTGQTAAPRFVAACLDDSRMEERGEAGGVCVMFCIHGSLFSVRNRQ